MAGDSAWKPLPADGAQLWTDDFSNLVARLQWEFSWRDLLQPAVDEAEFHNSIGTALGKQGRLDEAIAHLRKALKIKPNFAEALSNLGLALQKEGKLDEAIAHFRKALEIKPGFADARYNLGCVLFQQGQLDEAMDQFQEALRINPGYTQARNNLQVALSRWGQIRNALAEQRELLRKRPQDIALLNAAAWTLATNPNASVRNGTEAVELARRTVELSRGPEPGVSRHARRRLRRSGTLRRGRRNGAKALDLAAGQKKPSLVESLKAQISLYEAGAPYRESPPLPRTSPAQPRQ